MEHKVLVVLLILAVGCYASPRSKRQMDNPGGSSSDDMDGAPGGNSEMAAGSNSLNDSIESFVNSVLLFATFMPTFPLTMISMVFYWVSTLLNGMSDML